MRTIRANHDRRATTTEGFTFLELIVVLSILALMFTFGAIKLTSSLPKYALRTSAGNIGTEIERMRMIAISRGSWTGIRYHFEDESGRSAWQALPPAPLDYPNEPISEREPYPRETVETHVSIVAVQMRGTGEISESGPVDVYFSPTGTVGSHAVSLETKDGRQLSLSFNAITGTVDFFEGEHLEFDDFEG